MATKHNSLQKYNGGVAVLSYVAAVLIDRLIVTFQTIVFAVSLLYGLLKLSLVSDGRSLACSICVSSN